MSKQACLTLLNQYHITLDYLLKNQLCLVPLETEFALMYMKLKKMHTLVVDKGVLQLERSLATIFLGITASGLIKKKNKI